MNKRVFTAISLSILLAACGGSDDPEGNNREPEVNVPEVPEVPEVVALKAFKCPSNVATDAAYTADFTDAFVDAGIADRDWGVGKSDAFRFLVEDIKVADIAGQFNAARLVDPTVKEKLVMPTQDSWDAMDASTKGLFIVNSERCARGLRPFEGILPALNDSADIYAKSISAANNLSHFVGNEIADRMADAGVIQTGPTADRNADFVRQNESLAVVRVTGTGTTAIPPLYEVQVRAIYDWLYDDKTSQYGHRTHVFLNGYEENSGSVGVEGLYGLSSEEITRGAATRESWTVLHTFDAKSSFAGLSTMIAAPAIYGPQSQIDCEAGSTFAESADADGNNTSTCQAD